MTKKLGTLLPFSSLISKEKPGDYFFAARKFIDWLALTNQTVWQMLPISPCSGHSPYSTHGIGVDPKYGSFSDFVDLKNYALSKNVELWGDVPFYLDESSPLLEEYKNCFLLKSDFVAGCLYDKHFSDRQQWGMPLYDYSSPEKIAKILKLWKTRINFLANFFTRIRLDSAIRFFQYEKLSIIDEKLDKLAIGPGEKFFTELINYGRSCGVELFVEDISGLNMTALRRACKKLKVNTVSVFTMVLAPGARTIKKQDFNLDFLQNQIYYTSNHDTMPLTSYISHLSLKQQKTIERIFGKDILNSLREKCPTLIVAFQDWFKENDRINTPGEVNKSNWQYRMSHSVEELPLV